MKLLVIGYGNELRQDDGVGPQVARAVADWPDVEALAVHQLTPELALAVSQASRLVFVDAGHAGDHVRVQRLDGLAAASSWGHAFGPGDLLMLTAMLYGHRPDAWLIEVPADRFGFGMDLSAKAEQGLVGAIEQVRRLAGSRSPCGQWL